MTALGEARIGWVSARPGHVTEEGVFVHPGLGRLVDQLAVRCGELRVALSATPTRGVADDHRLQIEPDRFHPLPHFRSLAQGFWSAPAARSAIRGLEPQCDALVVQLPFAAPLALLDARTPRLYQVCGDVLQQARTSTWYSGARRLPALAVGHSIDRLQSSLIRSPKSRVVTHGEHLRRHYGGRGRAVVSSTLLASEIGSVTRRRPREAPFRVLFVGYLRHEKGVDTLLEAFAELRQRVTDAELVVIGGRDMVDTGVERQLAAIESASGTALRPTIDLRGAVPFGRELFQSYADADVLVLPSRSEGTPRVLVEARAFGCAVVASRVGGVPSSIDDGVDGLLFPPSDASTLAQQLLRLATDAGLRQRLTESGLERARRTTVETFADELMRELALLIADEEPSFSGRWQETEP